MPTHSKVGSDAATLEALVAEVEAAGEKIIETVQAGNTWTIITERQPKKPQTRKQTR